MVRCLGRTVIGRTENEGCIVCSCFVVIQVRESVGKASEVFDPFLRRGSKIWESLSIVYTCLILGKTLARFVHVVETMLPSECDRTAFEESRLRRTYPSAQHLLDACRAKVNRAASARRADTGSEGPEPQAPDRAGRPCPSFFSPVIRCSDHRANIRRARGLSDKTVSVGRPSSRIERALAHHEAAVA